MTVIFFISLLFDLMICYERSFDEVSIIEQNSIQIHSKKSDVIFDEANEWQKDRNDQILYHFHNNYCKKVSSISDDISGSAKRKLSLSYAEEGKNSPSESDVDGNDSDF